MVQVVWNCPEPGISSSHHVFWLVIDVDRTRGIKLQLFDGVSKYFWVWFHEACFMRVDSTVEKVENGVGGFKEWDMNPIGVGKQVESGADTLLLFDELNHRCVQFKYISNRIAKELGGSSITSELRGLTNEFIGREIASFQRN